MNCNFRMSGSHKNTVDCALDGPLRHGNHKIQGELPNAQAGFPAVSAQLPLRFQVDLLALTLL